MYDGYPAEKYRTAMELLALGPGTLQERLVEAAWESGMATTGKWPNQELRSRHDKLRAAFRAKNGPLGSHPATILPMTYDEAHELARELVEIAWALDRDFWRAMISSRTQVQSSS